MEKRITGHYGFTLERITDNGFRFYTKQDNERYVELMVAGDTLSISLYNTESEQPSEMVVACRYKVETEEQLDFLLCNGRVGYLFRS